MSTGLIASFRARQSAEEASARLGLSGPAQVARHEAISARATRAAARILHLVEQGKHAQALALLNLPDWGQGEEEHGSLYCPASEREERSGNDGTTPA